MRQCGQDLLPSRNASEIKTRSTIVTSHVHRAVWLGCMRTYLFRATLADATPSPTLRWSSTNETHPTLPPVSAPCSRPFWLLASSPLTYPPIWWTLSGTDPVANQILRAVGDVPVGIPDVLYDASDGITDLSGVAVLGNGVFWGDGANLIRRAAADGSSISPMTQFDGSDGVSGANGVSVTVIGDFVYWAQSGGIHRGETILVSPSASLVVGGGNVNTANGIVTDDSVRLLGGRRQDRQERSSERNLTEATSKLYTTCPILRLASRLLAISCIGRSHWETPSVELTKMGRRAPLSPYWIAVVRPQCR